MTETRSQNFIAIHRSSVKFRGGICQEVSECQEALMRFEIEGKEHLDKIAKNVSEENITNSQPTSLARVRATLITKIIASKMKTTMSERGKSCLTMPCRSQMMLRPEVKLSRREERYPLKPARVDLR